MGSMFSIRRLFQIHLSTAVMLMLAAGGLGLFNTIEFRRVETRLSDFGPPEYDPQQASESWLFILDREVKLDHPREVRFQIIEMGWPVAYAKHEHELVPKENPSFERPSDPEFKFNDANLKADVFAAVEFLFGLGFISEMLIRRGISATPYLRALRYRLGYVLYWAIDCFITDVSPEKGFAQSSADV